MQESLTNVYRHSNSKVAEMELVRNGQKLHVKVRDYGNGGTAADLKLDRPGVGISGMRERVLGLGGEFKIYDAGPGTAVEVELPITPPASKSA